MHIVNLCRLPAIKNDFHQLITPLFIIDANYNAKQRIIIDLWAKLTIMPLKITSSLMKNQVNA